MMFFLHRLRSSSKASMFSTTSPFARSLAAITAFAISLLFGNFVIRKLISLKIGQPIRTADEVHRLAELHGGKQGTPTMGGVLVIGSVVIASSRSGRDRITVSSGLSSSAWSTSARSGFVDDYLKVTKKKSDGISGRLKLVFQLALAGIVTGGFPHQSFASKCRRARSICPFSRCP